MKRLPTGRELMRLYDLMYRHTGDLHWWPGETPIEICVGAILTQNTAWKNVEKAIAELRAAKALSVRALGKMAHGRLAKLIRSAGYFNVKAKRLKNFIAHVETRHGGSLDAMLAQPAEALRAELLSINGVGPETADSIVLYAAAKPTFVIDAYTKRILSRHKVLPLEKSYDDFQALFARALAPDAPLYNQYHAMFVRIGNRFCRATPRCDLCPLNGWRGVPK
ncbi:MAG TPA: endonuclease III domain-containing protein [Candidatus Binatia bacterium]|jgi:endonuclease-3 related protein|nr:endonuclease III domain-containing protein [Candidatus Binatia bacterium]